MNCLKCGSIINEKDKKCLKCGTFVNKANNKKNNLWIPFLIIVIICVGAIGISIYNYFFDNGNNNPNHPSDGTTKDTKVLGNKDFGYIITPNDWGKFDDPVVSDIIKFSTTQASGIYIISMHAVDYNEMDSDEYIEDFVETYKREDNVEFDETKSKIGKYEARRFKGNYLTGAKIISYFFEPGDGKTHYLAIEGYDEGVIDEYIRVIFDTFSLTK